MATGRPEPKRPPALEQAGARQKAYRAACAWTAKEQGAQRLNAEKLHLTITFVPPNRRAHDLDNCLARMKSGLDGLADVLGWTTSIDADDQQG